MKKLAKITLEIEVDEGWKYTVATESHMGSDDSITDGVACAVARKQLADELNDPSNRITITKLGKIVVKTFRIDYEGKEKKR